ncbi:hypothetical protein [Methylogaea oryzae]|uniref:hypothetical protein n=1 Tax=Methylogaea oryzae TaxID=1295382 RepID=UPI000A848738|nr:hypothetical protein [Methylogaea oryzae]
MFAWLDDLQKPLSSGDDRAFRRLGLWLVFWVFGVFGIWAALAPLNSAALRPA